MKDTQTQWSCRKCQDKGIDEKRADKDSPFGIHNFCLECDKWKKMFHKRSKEKKQVNYRTEQKKEKIEFLLKKSGVSDRFREKTLADLKWSPELLKILKWYVDNFEKYRKEWRWIYFRWNIGTGKTHAMTALCNALIDTYFVPVMFVNLAEVANRVKATFWNWNAEAHNSDLFEKMKTTELLFIDDLGIEKPTDWLKENIFVIINYRYDKKLPTFITSNKSTQQLAVSFVPQIASRLNEMCKAIRFAGTDRRENNRPDF